MTSINNIHTIEKIVGNMLVKQSQLDKSRIMNAITPRGVSLSKFITDNVKLSYDLNDVVIIFEVTTTNIDDINFTEYDTNNIREDAAFEIKITIYGNESIAMAKILKARFESEKVRSDLLDSGLYLIDTTSAMSLNDFLNDTMWPRADWSFRVACEMYIDEVDEMPNITNVDELNIEALSKSGI